MQRERVIFMDTYYTKYYDGWGGGWVNGWEVKSKVVSNMDNYSAEFRPEMDSPQLSDNDVDPDAVCLGKP